MTAPGGLLARLTRRLDPILALAERVDRRRRHIRPIRPGGVLAIELQVHRGATVALADGTTIDAGARVVVIHFRNERVQAVATSGWQGEVRRRVRDDFAALARWWRHLPPDERPVAIHAVTLLGRALRREGWEVRRRKPGLRALVDDWYMGWLMEHWSAGTEGGARRREHPPRRPEVSMEAWMSGASLLARHPGAPRPEASPGDPPALRA